MTFQMTNEQAREIAKNIGNSLSTALEDRPAISVQSHFTTVTVKLYLKNSDVGNVKVNIILSNNRGDYGFYPSIDGYSFSFADEHAIVALDLASLIQQAYSIIQMARSFYNDQIAKLIINS